MRLYTLLVAICVTKSVLPAELSPPASSSSDNDVEDSDDYVPILDWSDTFDWQLLKAVSAETRGNVLISPLSLKLALVLLYEGSAGSTEKQFQSVLQFPPEKKEIREKYKHLLDVLREDMKHYVLNIGTSLFLDSSIKPNQQYAAIIQSAYDTIIQSTNFTQTNEASQAINSWVENITNGRINRIVSPNEIQDDALMIVANAVYFKGLWRHQFPKNATHDGGFYVSPTEVVTVPYMSLTDRFHYAESKELDAKFLRLPYKGKHFSLFIVLPNSKGGLADLIKNANLQRIKRQLFLMDVRTVDVVIPKFSFDFSSSYSKILQDFGLNTIFSNTASFPNIARGVGSGTKWLFVNEIKQKAGIEVNEEGSVAYASTTIQLGNKFGEADLSFNATHPFMIFLEDQTTGSILFAGKVENPLQSSPLPSRFGDQDTNVGTKPETPMPAFQGISTQRPLLQLNPAPEQEEGNRVSTSTYRFNYFDIELLRRFDETRNYFISPASIKSTLGMVLEGARGRCAQQIAGVLGIPVDPSATREKLKDILYNFNAQSTTTLLEAANGVFVSNAYQIIPEFKNNVERYYRAKVESLNFADNEGTARHINNWVDDVTRGLIKELVTPANFNADATLVIANALYFKGKWKHEFEGTTSLKCFRNHKSDCIRTPIMQTSNNFNYKYLDDLNAQAIELPYGDGQYAMMVVLPNEKSSVDELIRDFQHIPSPAFASIVDRLEPSEVQVLLPRFEIDYTADLVNDLQALGIKEIFTQNANLSGIIPGGQIKINNIVHKAKIEVNEKGTVAAAATGVIVIPLMGSSTPRFDATRPFLFFIYHVPTKNIIFEGRFNDPVDSYDEIFARPPQTSRPIPQAPVTQSPKSQHFQKPQQQPVSLSIDNAPVQQAFAPVPPSENLYYPRYPVPKAGENYDQPARQNSGNFQRSASYN